MLQDTSIAHSLISTHPITRVVLLPVVLAENTALLVFARLDSFEMKGNANDDKEYKRIYSATKFTTKESIRIEPMSRR